jgi:hypothetical protein
MVLTPDIITRVTTIAQKEGAKPIAKNSRLFHISDSNSTVLEERGDHDYSYESDSDDAYDPHDYVTDTDPADLLDDEPPFEYPHSTNMSPDDTPAPPVERSVHNTEAMNTNEEDTTSTEPDAINTYETSDDDSASTQEPHTDTDYDVTDSTPVEYNDDNDDDDDYNDETNKDETNANENDHNNIDNTHEENQRSAGQDQDQRSAYSLRDKERVNYNTLHKSGFTFHQNGKMSKDLMHQEVVNRVVESILKKEGEINDKTQTETHFYETAIKRWGDIAMEAVYGEMAQINNKEVIAPVHKHDLSPEELEKVLDTLTFVTRKRCGKMKGRCVVDGRAQNEPREKTASPTLTTESLFTTIMIALFEERHCMSGDVPGAFLNGVFDEKVHVKFRGRLVEILCRVNEEYKQFVTYENGQKVMYVLLNKALYGTVQAALIWYKMFVSTLKSLGFELNPYDLCVANAMKQGSQCTIAFYVDDLIGTHKSKEVLHEVKKAIENEYGDIGATFSDKFTYLGIDFELDRENRWCKATMISHLRDAVSDFEKLCNLEGRKPSTPALTSLFEVNHESPLLAKEKQDAFRSIVMKTMYVGKRTRLDLLTTIAFLSTRQGKATEEDWKKLKRMMQYIQGTIDMPLIFSADNLERFHTFVDVAYAVNCDRKSQTGGLVSFGRGAIHAQSTKQKLNSRSSTEGEIIGCSDYLTMPIWFGYFLKAQGYGNVKSTLHQDNKSAINIERNGQLSMSKNTKHIEIRYFYVKDRTNGNNIQIKYCPTEQMIADFLTKPLQGELFRKFRAVILGHVHLDEVSLQPTTCKERVGENEEKRKVNQNTNPKYREDEKTGETIEVEGKRLWSDVVRGEGYVEGEQGNRK